MDTQSIINELEQKRKQIGKAIHALSSGLPTTLTRRGRRKMSAAAKKRISIRMKKSWRERKKARLAK